MNFEGKGGDDSLNNHSSSDDAPNNNASNNPSPDSPNDQLSFDLTIIAGCSLLMLLCFCVKTPWYLRGLLHL